MNAFNDNKAGMSGLDKERIERVIAENTSANFGSHSAKRKRRIDARIARIHETLAALTPAQLRQFEHEADSVLAGVEAERDLSRVIVHLDMDAFFAAVEMRDAPELRAVPMAVGGESMLSTSNYVARRFGVRAAMPGFIARKLCTELVIVPGHYDKYRHESAAVRRVFTRYDANVRMGSLDEACLDITDFVAQRLQPVILPRVRYDGSEGRCICRLPLLTYNTSAGDNALARENGGRKKSTCDINVPSTSSSSTEDAFNGESSTRTETDAPLCAPSTSSASHSPPAVVGEVVVSESTCKKCGKIRRALTDAVEFGTSVEDVVNEIRFQVEQETGLTCSAGIAANWRLAKVCSDMRKPNGQFRVANERGAVVEFMRALPTRKVPGVGAVTDALLQSVGVTRCGDFVEKRAELRAVFSRLQFNWFMAVALGVHGHGGADEDDGEESGSSDRRSISIERTFAPQSAAAFLFEQCAHLCDALAADCRRSGVAGGRTATVKIKYASFDVVTRARSTPHLIATAEALRPVALALLKRELASRDWPKVRLLGVRLSRLVFCDDGDENANNSALPSSSSSSVGGQRTLVDYLRRKPTRMAPHPTAAVNGEEAIEVVDLCDDDSDADGEHIDGGVVDNGDDEAHVVYDQELSEESIQKVKSGESDDDEICVVLSTLKNRAVPPLAASSSSLEGRSAKKRPNATTFDERTSVKRGKRSKAKPKNDDGANAPVANVLNRYFPMVL